DSGDRAADGSPLRRALDDAPVPGAWRRLCRERPSDVHAGPYAAFLGQSFDPVWCDFDGPGTKIAPHYTDGQTKDFHDPFAATTAAGRFKLSTLGQLNDDLPVERLNLR